MPDTTLSTSTCAIPLPPVPAPAGAAADPLAAADPPRPMADNIFPKMLILFLLLARRLPNTVFSSSKRSKGRAAL